MLKAITHFAISITNEYIIKGINLFLFYIMNNILYNILLVKLLYNYSFIFSINS